MSILTTYPFPFVGAGEATNFEWCYLFIKFDGKPDEKAVGMICDSSIPPLKVYPENIMGSMLHVGSSPYVNQAIEHFYGDGIIPAGKGIEYYCSEKARRRFQEALVHWLITVHQATPIDIVLRPEDDEAEGTRLSRWHHDSLERVSGLIKKWLDQYREMNAAGEQSFFRQMAEELGRYELANLNFLIKSF